MTNTNRIDNAHLSRRQFLAATAATGAGLAIGWPATHLHAAPAVELEDEAAFFVISDTHYLAERDATTRLRSHIVDINRRLIDTLNTLPGQRLPEQLGGGAIAEPRGVIHLGDIVDTGDKFGATHEAMTDTEWKAYVEDFGLTGSDGRLKYPVYEVHGNHDSPRQRNSPIRGIIDRNASRPGLTSVSENGLHYSWDWGGIHFVALGIVVGPNDDDRPISRYDSFDSLPFLVKDLAENVGDSGRPAVLMHHVDLRRYSRGCDDEQPVGGSREICCEGMARVAWCSGGCPGRPDGIRIEEWSACDVSAYYRAIQPYNIAAAFHGHLHSRHTDTWAGRLLNARTGIPVFGANNSGAGGGNRSFYYCRIEDDALVIREYHSAGEHGWDPERATLTWTPQSWRIPLRT